MTLTEAITILFWISVFFAGLGFLTWLGDQFPSVDFNEYKKKKKKSNTDEV